MFPRLTAKDMERGWYPLDCGCCGHVFSIVIANLVPSNRIRCCPVSNLPGVVDIVWLESIERIRKEKP